MRYFSFLVLLLISLVSYGQNIDQNDANIFRAVICTVDTKNREIVFYASVLGIDKYEFYQDSKSYNESYQAKVKDNAADTLGGQIIDLSNSHNLIINHYDKSPFKIISNYSSIDTSEINKFLNTYKDYRNKTKIWSQLVCKCKNVKYIKRFRPKLARILFNQDCIFVSTPILLIRIN